MDTIRVNKVMKDFNIGINTLAEFLKKKGIEIEVSPNAKISEDDYALVAKEFGKEQIIKEQSKKVAIKVKEITDSEYRNNEKEEVEPVKEVIIKTNITSQTPEQKPEVEKKIEIPVEAPEVKLESEELKTDLKIVGKIDLNPKPKKEKFEKVEIPEEPKAEEPKDIKVEKIMVEKKEEITEEPKESKEVPLQKESAVAQEKKEKTAAQSPVAEKKPEYEHIKTEYTKLTGPKIVGTKDLSSFEKKKSASIIAFSSLSEP